MISLLKRVRGTLKEYSYSFLILESLILILLPPHLRGVAAATPPPHSYRREAGYSVCYIRTSKHRESLKVYVIPGRDFQLDEIPEKYEISAELRFADLTDPAPSALIQTGNLRAYTMGGVGKELLCNFHLIS